MSEQTNQSEQHLTEEQMEQTKEIARKIIDVFNSNNVNPSLSIHALEQVMAINLFNLEYMTGNDAIKLSEITNSNVITLINHLRNTGGYTSESLN